MEIPNYTDEHKKENTAKEVGNIFKYFKLLTILSFSFVMMYMENLEWIGILFGAAVNEVVITYLALDYSISPKHHDLIIFLLELILKFKILAEYLVFLLIIDLQRRYTNIGSSIQLSRESKHKMEIYKKSFIENTVLLLVVSFIFFTSERTQYGKISDGIAHVEHDQYLDFFHSFSVIDNDPKSLIIDSDTPDEMVTKMIYKVFCYGWYFVKIVLVLLLVYTTGMLTLSAEQLAHVNTTRLYIAHKTETNDKELTVPEKTNSFMGYANNAFSNLNLNYMMYYNYN